MELNGKGKGVDEPLRIRKFEVGDLVFAKLKGYPPWPSKINQIESIISGGKEVIRYNVFFYGTHQSSLCRSSVLYHYDTYAKAIVDKWGRKQKFHDALKELEREMMDKITYLNQLRSTTPESPWCHGFSTACDDLANDIDKAQGTVTSKSHCKPKQNIIQDLEDEIMDESRRIGYEVLYIERIPFPDTPESLIVLSLSYNPEWVKQESKNIKEEERMKSCFVKIEPFPAKYAHLDPNRIQKSEKSNQHMEFKIKSENAVQPTVDTFATLKEQKQTKSSQQVDMAKDLSDDSDVEAVETCLICRSCFFSQDELRKHMKSEHVGTSTAELLFDRMVTNEPVAKKGVTSWKEGYPLGRLM